MLHFAAKFGLEKLMWHLLESPGGEQACQLRNVSQMTPVDMAEASNHQKLAQALKGHMQMTELTSMYSILKGISDGHHQSQQPQQPYPSQQSQKFEQYQQFEEPQQPQELQQSQQPCNDEPGTSYGMPPSPDSSYVVPQSPGPIPRLPDANYLIPRSQDANYLIPRSLDDNYLVPPTPRPVESTTNIHNYTNVRSSPTNMAMFNYQVPPPPQSFFSTNYQVPTNGRPYSPGGNWYSGTPPTMPSSPVDKDEPHGGYLEMSSSKLFCCEVYVKPAIHVPACSVVIDVAFIYFFQALVHSVPPIICEETCRPQTLSMATKRSTDLPIYQFTALVVRFVLSVL